MLHAHTDTQACTHTYAVESTFEQTVFTKLETKKIRTEITQRPKDELASIHLKETDCTCVSECVLVCVCERERSAVSATVLSMLKHICIPVENCSTGEEKVKKKG